MFKRFRSHRGLLISTAFIGISSERHIYESTLVRQTKWEWPRYCRKVYWIKTVQNGPNDHFGQNDLIPNWILAFARPKWTKMVHFGPFWPGEVHFGPFRSANHTLAIPEQNSRIERNKLLSEYWAGGRLVCVGCL